MTPYPKAYIDYLAEYYGSRDYFECHEIMEEYWKQHPHSALTHCWLVLIRISVCLYHARRGNWTGAIKLMGKAAKEVDARRFDQLGMDGDKPAIQLMQTAQAWSEPEARYADLELPITDAALLAAVQQRCAELGYAWGKHGQDADDEIIHRHLTRDRSEVVQARAMSAERKALIRGVSGTDGQR